jgi:hypothetical protein
MRISAIRLLQAALVLTVSREVYLAFHTILQQPFEEAAPLLISRRSFQESRKRIIAPKNQTKEQSGESLLGRPYPSSIQAGADMVGGAPDQPYPSTRYQGRMTYDKKSLEHPAVPKCFEELNQTYCCAQSWEHNLDDWWQHHAGWQVSFENDTTFCFSPIASQERRLYLEKIIYPLQWETDCSQVSSNFLANAGFSANLGINGKAFMTAMLQNKTYTMTKKFANIFWQYAVWPSGQHVCPATDMTCFFLPITHCKVDYGIKDDFLPNANYNLNGGPNTWLRHYLIRPQQWMRRKVYNILRDVLTKIRRPCSTLHVRRTDAILEGNWRKRRHYFALQDYLDYINLRTTESVVLLTDDQTTIDEARQLHPHVPWIYFNRTRWQGTMGGYNSHLPSGDPVVEMAFLLAELQLGGQCRHLVHTKSGFRDVVLQYMQIHHGARNLRLDKIDRGRNPNATYTQSMDEFFAHVGLNVSLNRTNSSS